MHVINQQTKDALNTLGCSQIQTGQGRSLDNDQKEMIAYFFMRMTNIFGPDKMKSTWPDEQSLKLARREYGLQIAKYSREELSGAFDLVHKERRGNNRRFEWPNIDAILGLLSNEGVFTGSAGLGAHKIYKPELPTCTRSERKEWAKSGIASLREIMG